MAQLPTQSQFGDYGDWPGRDVLDPGGERMGAVREIYLDRETGRPEWVLVDVEGDEPRFVPLADATVESSAIRVAHSASAVRNAPGIGAEPRIDQSDERRLYEHYGVGYSTDESPSGLPAGVDDEPKDVAPEEDEAAEPTSVAPAPPEPPAAEEIEQADTPEPPAGTDSTDEPVVLSPSAAGLSAEPDRQEAPVPVPPQAPSPPDGGPGVFSAPQPPTPPEAVEPVPPPAPAEEAGGKLDAVKSPKVGIAAAVALAAALFFIIRKLR